MLLRFFASVECGTRRIADLRTCGVIESFVFKFFTQVDFSSYCLWHRSGGFALVWAGVKLPAKRHFESKIYVLVKLAARAHVLSLKQHRI